MPNKTNNSNAVDDITIPEAQFGLQGNNEVPKDELPQGAQGTQANEQTQELKDEYAEMKKQTDDATKSLEELTELLNQIKEPPKREPKKQEDPNKNLNFGGGTKTFVDLGAQNLGAQNLGAQHKPMNLDFSKIIQNAGLTDAQRQTVEMVLEANSANYGTAISQYEAQVQELNARLASAEENTNQANSEILKEQQEQFGKVLDQVQTMKQIIEGLKTQVQTKENLIKSMNDQKFIKDQLIQHPYIKEALSHLNIKTREDFERSVKPLIPTLKEASEVLNKNSSYGNGNFFSPLDSSVESNANLNNSQSSIDKEIEDVLNGILRIK